MELTPVPMSIIRRRSIDKSTMNRPMSLQFYHDKPISYDRSTSVDSSHSCREITRSDSQCSFTTKRSFLRKRIIELKEHEGIKCSQRAVCFPQNPQIGTIKWLGKINQVTYIGIEFDNPISSQIKENVTPLPFPSKPQHGHLLPLQDLIIVTDSSTNETIYRPLKKGSPPPRPPPPAFINFSQKLQEFYDFSQKAEETFENLGEQFESCSNSFSILKLKSSLSLVEDHFSLIDWCRQKSEHLFTFDNIILPSEEREIQRTINNLSEMHNNLETKLKGRIKNLEFIMELTKNLQDKMQTLSETKGQIRKLEMGLIKTKKQLEKRIYNLENILVSLFDPEEVFEKLPELPEGNEFESKIEIILKMRKEIVEEVEKKLEILKEAGKLFEDFSKRISEFEEWYDQHFARVCEEMFTGDEVGTSAEEMAKEREVKRKDFLEILMTARKLRVSIFHASVLDDRIQSLQMKWRALMDRCYRDTFRKTV